jgi:hypothetical protein
MVMVLKGRSHDPANDPAGPSQDPNSPETAAPGWPLVWLSCLALALYMIDRSLLPLALLALAPLAAVSVLKAGRSQRLRLVLAAMSSLVIVGQTVPAGGRLDLLGTIPGATGRNADQAGEFLRFSIGEPDRSLLRFLVTRTSVGDPILSLPRSSSLLATFGGRTTVLLPGIASGPMIDRTVASLNSWYQNEQTFYDYCRHLGVEYVVYSIDLVLDGSRYSPIYLSGNRWIHPASTAYKMHFFPETLNHFTLMYENGVYRLFKVTGTSGPFFSTDHPPVYQYEILERNNDTLDGFYQRVQRLLLLYNQAGSLLLGGSIDQALEMFDDCIEQAPHFTAAVLGRASALSARGELEAALDTYRYVVGYAPDNPEALYGTSLCLARLGNTDQAREYIDILMSATADQKILEKARLLGWFIEQGIPVDRSMELPDSAR